LVNYISFAGYLQDDVAFRERWPALHIIGKDILIPAHGIYWLAMLKAMGFADEEMPTFLVHGYVLVDGDKMSKSLGNIRDPHTFADNFGVEALRYYLMRDCVVGQDMDFTDQRLIQRFNSELANGLGNLVNRTLTMAHRYRGGRLSRSLENGLRDHALAAARAYAAAMEGRSINLALEKVAELVTEANQFVERSAPWKLARETHNEAHLDAIFYHLAEVIRLIALMISPVIPKSAGEILQQLNWSGPLALTETSWGILPEGHQLGKPHPIFPRIEATARVD
jgi:methionyl-tRNA synthetase